MIKLGVDLRGLTPQMAVAHTIACWVYFKCTGNPSACVITSARDGTHGPNSLHSRNGQCNALDLRTNTLTAEQLPHVVKDLTRALGEQFDVVLESDHIHIEWDPKDPAKDTHA